MMADNVTPFPRAVRPAPDPLGLYLRVGRNDHREILNLIASGDAACFGLVFDPTQLRSHEELKSQVLAGRLDAILDPRTQQSALAGGYTPSLGQLPWNLEHRIHHLRDFEGTSGQRLIGCLSDYVVEHGFTQIIAPTHVTDGANDPWIPVDTESTRRLRSYLDRRGGASVQIIYSLALPYAAFRDATQRRVVIEALKTVPINALWLRIDGFGSSSSATAARMYIQAAADFHSLGVPVVGDHVGGMIGLALLAFGALGGISHGITFGERFETAPWRRPRNENGFGIGRRVYIPALDVMLKPRDAKALLESSTKARSMFGCADPKCCPRGVKDMLENPARHFVYKRMKEIAGLSQIPESLRPQRFLDHHLRPATDKAVASTTINWENRRRLDSLRIALGSHAERHPPGSFATLPKTRAARESRR